MNSTVAMPVSTSHSWAKASPVPATVAASARPSGQ